MEVLISHEDRPRNASSGLRRSRSSGTLFGAEKQDRTSKEPRRSSRNAQSDSRPLRIKPAEPSQCKSNQHKTPRPTSKSSSQISTSTGIRRSSSETAISQQRHPGRPKRSQFSVVTKQPPAPLDHEQTYAPPSSPLSRSPPQTDESTSHAPGWMISEDDLAVKEEPNKRVDYLSHPWTIQELSDSWRYIVKNRLVFGDLSRLENSAWRCWWKTMGNLKTLNPEKLNWYKDNDVTWLYGPLHAPDNFPALHTPSEPPSQLSKTNSFLTKKSILKKRSMSEILLQKSLSNSSLLRQAATAARLQQDRPKAYPRRQSDFTPAIMTIRSGAKDYMEYFSSSSTSGLQTPSEGGKHIQFAEEVEQCIAVETKVADDEDDDARSSITYIDDDWSGDEGFLFMKSSRHNRRMSAPRQKRRHSTGERAKMIEVLPATTLNDTPKSETWPEGPSHSLSVNQTWHPKSRLSPSPSAETLRPRNPSKNFLIHDPTDDFMDNSENSSEDESSGVDEEQMLQTAQEEAEKQRGLRRTGSGMLMPANGEEADDPAFGGLVGTILDTVNTARDIAHVVWNVGWRR